MIAFLAFAAAEAHTLDAETARISLRDAHVSIDADLDLFRLVEADVTALATGADEPIAALRSSLRDTLEDGSALRVDGTEVRLNVRELPPIPEFRGAAAILSSQGESHGVRLRVRLDSPDAFPNARNIELELPQELGPVVVTFVQPATQWVVPGSKAKFTVLQPEAGIPNVPSDPPLPAEAHLALLAVGGLSVAGALHWHRERRRTQGGG